MPGPNKQRQAGRRGRRAIEPKKMSRAVGSQEYEQAEEPVEQPQGARLPWWRGPTVVVSAGWAVVATVLAFVGKVMTVKSSLAQALQLLIPIDDLLFNGRLRPILLSRPGWFLVKFAWLLVIEAAGFAVIAASLRWIAQHGDMSLHSKIRRAALASVPVLIVLPLVAIAAIGLTAGGSYRLGHPHPSEDVAVVCPQCARLGTCGVFTYANNGEADYSVDPAGDPGGPRGHARITLQAYLPDVTHNAGWVIFLPPGVDLSEHKQLRFSIRGEKGGERIGVKAKDAHGVEVPVLVNDRYIVGSRASPAPGTT